MDLLGAQADQCTKKTDQPELTTARLLALARRNGASVWWSRTWASRCSIHYSEIRESGLPNLAIEVQESAGSRRFDFSANSPESDQSLGRGSFPDPMNEACTLA
jgi:hypothetical protein